MNFGELLKREVQKKGNCVCVGLDPRLDLIPSTISHGKTEAGAYEEFCYRIIDIVAPLVPVVKPQAAFFEALGPSGCQALANVNAYAKQRGLVVIMDAKRGDIGSTAEAYAQAYLSGIKSNWNCDSLTVNPFLGDDTLEPFLKACVTNQSGIFVLVKTSNPGSAFIQQAKTNRRDVSQQVAEWITNKNNDIIARDDEVYGPIGAVVGATYPGELQRLRNVLYNSWLLIPGYGAQGGTAKELVDAWNDDGLGAIVNSSRGIIFAYQNSKEVAHDWMAAVKQATVRMIEDLANAQRIAK